jgi:hypothetical protein
VPSSTDKNWRGKLQIRGTPRASLESNFRAYNAALQSKWRATKNETIRTIS